MTLDSIGKLIVQICVHWPNAKKNYLTAEGKVSKTVAEEWYRRIGFLEDDQADKMFEEYLTNADVNKYPPGVPYFLGQKPHRPSKYHHAPDMANLRFTVERGDIIDQEGRIWAGPEDPERKYYVNGLGHICYKDKDEREVVFYK